LQLGLIIRKEDAAEPEAIFKITDKGERIRRSLQKMCEVEQEMQKRDENVLTYFW